MSGEWIQCVRVGLVGQLTPLERLEAMRQIDRGRENLLTDAGLMLLGVLAACLFVLLLVMVRRLRLQRENRQVQQAYDAASDRLNLTAPEREILEAIAIRTGEPQKGAVFEDVDVFETGLGRLMQDVFADGHNLVYRKKLQAAVHSIKEKLGFVKPAPTGQPRSSKDQSSRHIPVGKTVLLWPAGGKSDRHVLGEVIANDAFEWVIRPETPLAGQAGRMWRVRYDDGAVTWELDAITLAVSETCLELNHSDRIRFVNRRRFPRVAVRKPALMAALPMFRAIQDGEDFRPDFVQAQINEISGPSLRVDTPLELAFNDRVLVIFELEPGRVVQDIGQVRDFRKTPLGRAVIVELVGLNDHGIAELVRVSNQLIAQRASVEGDQETGNILAEAT